MKKNLNFFLAIILYLLLGIYFLTYYQYQINGDGICYIIIAQKYLKGDFGNAINGYWSPLISWLLIPFLLMGMTPLLACKILSLIIGLFVIFSIRLLSNQFEIGEHIRSAIIFSSVLPVLLWAYYFFTPDLLVVMLLVFYFTLIFSKNYPQKKYNGILCGLLGGAGYLAKAYLFPFYLIHFLSLSLFHYLFAFNEKKNILKNLLYGLLVFIGISGIWIAIISNKYNTLTTGTVGRYAYYVYVVGAGHSMQAEGFLAPFPGTDITVWEDPSYFPFKKGLQLQSPLRQLEVFYENAVILLNIYKNFSTFSYAIIVTGILLLLLYFKKIFHEKTLFFSILTFVFYPAGYLLIHLEERFTWVNQALIILAGGYLLNLLLKDKNINNMAKKLLLILFIFSWWYVPIITLYQYKDMAGKSFYDWSNILKNQYGIAGNIASDKGFWKETLYLAYYLNAKNYGEPKDKNISFEELKKDFKEYNIDYYFLWDTSDTHMIDELSSNYYQIRDTRLPFYIYKLRKIKN